MKIPAHSPSCFRFIEPSHPFYDQIVEFDHYICESKAYREMTARQATGLPVSIHAEIKSKDIDGKRRIDRFYYSIQFPGPSLPGGWYGWSLHYSGKTGGVTEYEFPYDPKLPHLADFILAPENADIKVLRYVPLRRVTFLRPRRNGSPDLIGKLKKPNRANDGYVRLARAHDVCPDFGFVVPRAVELDNENSVFYQSLAPGLEVTDLLNERNYLDLLAGIGKVHGQLGKCPIAKDNRWDRDGIKDDLWRDLAEIAFYLPEKAAFIDRLGGWITHNPLKLTGANTAFCHGDFACSQILRTEDGWSVVDLDLSGAGDPYQDIAMFMASLSHDVPLLQSRQDLLAPAQTVYLEAFRQTSDIPIYPDALTWYLVCAEIYYLALILKKDRFCQAAFDSAELRLSKLTSKESA